MNYADFSEAYEEIINISCRKLKNNRFAAFVVGEIRDSKGAYRDFVGLTKSLFRKNGLHLYADSVFLEQYGTAPMRAGKQFEAKRKPVKVHQNVLVFYKGDLNTIERINQQDIEKADLSKFQ